MKNITKYILAAAAAFSSLTACQEFEDFEKTIDGTPGLVYVQTGTGKPLHDPGRTQAHRH